MLLLIKPVPPLSAMVKPSQLFLFEALQQYHLIRVTYQVTPIRFYRAGYTDHVVPISLQTNTKRY